MSKKIPKEMSLKKKRYNMTDYITVPFRIAPVATSLSLINRIIGALVPSIQILATASFIDTALAIFNGTTDYNKIYLPLALIALLLFYRYAISTVMWLVGTKMNNKFSETFRVAVVNKRASLEYRHIENNDTWELINRVGGNPAGRLLNGYDVLINMVTTIINVVSVLSVLMAYVWWAGLIILGFSIPLFVLAAKSGKATYIASKEAAKHSRKAGYLHDVLYSRENTEERTLFGYTDKLNEEWLDKSETARKIRLKSENKRFAKMKGASLITVIISSAIAGVLIAPLSSGLITIGLFMGLVSGAFSLVQMMSWSLSYNINEMTNNNEYLKDLTKFSALSECKDADALPDINIQQNEPDSIEFVNVSFKYPDTENYILKDMSLKLEKGKHYAIVGINGAGKTTLTKLLTGLYDNFEGEILIGGKSIREYTQSQLKGLFSVVYQDFAKYQISLKENIALGNVNGCTDTTINNAIEYIGLDEAVKDLPNGIDTNLGKIRTDAVDLSGGQWQRVAIARTLASNAPIRILDEPTAALDPVAESAVYEMFGKVSKNKSTIFITHRLGAAKLADEILVIDEGRVKEFGSHNDLVKRGGLYADMFESQRSWYL